MAVVYLVHIPQRSNAGIRIDVIGGQIAVMFDAVTTVAVRVRADKMKAMATSKKQRSAVLRDVPTMS